MDYRDQDSWKVEGGVAKLPSSTDVEVKDNVQLSKGDENRVPPAHVVKNERHFVFLVVSKLNNTIALVRFGSGKTVQDTMRVLNLDGDVWKLVAFVVGFNSLESASLFKNKWQEEIKYMISLQDKALEGKNLCDDFGTKVGAEKLNFIVDWNKIDAKAPGNVDCGTSGSIGKAEHENNPDIPDPDTIMPFGKHAGMTYSDIAVKHPGYVDWVKSLSSPSTELQRLINFVGSSKMKKNDAAVKKAGVHTQEEDLTMLSSSISREPVNVVSPSVSLTKDNNSLSNVSDNGLGNSAKCHRAQGDRHVDASLNCAEAPGNVKCAEMPYFDAIKFDEKMVKIYNKTSKTVSKVVAVVEMLLHKLNL